jgi:hypothetical protein
LKSGEQYRRIGIQEKPRGLDRISFPIPGRLKEPAFLVSEIASAEGFDRNQEDDRRSAKKALQP